MRPKTARELAFGWGSALLVACLLVAMLAGGCRTTGHLETSSVSPGGDGRSIPVVTPTRSAAPEQAIGFSADEIATLSSLEKIDDYPLYTMHYQGIYDRQGETQEPASMSQVLPRDALRWGCSLFAALADSQGSVYGRNFDWQHSPALLLFTAPPQVYASISLVDIAYLGFTGQQAQELVGLSLLERRALLDAPFLPFDGMNERGLAIGMAAVPSGNVPNDPDKETLGSLGVMREVLDRAANVDEGVRILQSYNIDFSGGPPIHYLLADASGKAALVEHYQGQVEVILNEQRWLQATNFLVSGARSDSAGNCWRYDKINRRLAENQGMLTMAAAMSLLASVAQENTQWSVVYGMHSGLVNIALEGDYRQVYNFRLELDAENR